MKKEQKNSLLDKYYKGETLLEEENILKEVILNENILSPEKDVFNYFDKQKQFPAGLEDKIFEAIKKKEKKKKSLVRKIYSYGSAAAILIVLLTIFLDFRQQKIQELESQFMVMEQAIFQVSESIRPEEQEEMLVLWVDDNVEIIIN